MKAQPAVEQSSTVPHLSEIEPLRVNKILVPIDFSASAERAFRYALRFARQFGSEIILIHVLEPLTTDALDHATESADNRLVHAEMRLQALAETPAPTGDLYITSTIRNGVPTHEIVEAATEFGVDLIITSIHGLNGWKHFGFETTADRVGRAWPCPILVVQP